MQAQDTDEKVGKISDNVTKLSDYQGKNDSKLEEIKNTVAKGFKDLTDRFGMKPDDYGKVTDEHLNVIYDFLDEKEKRRGTTEVQPPENYGQVTDEHLDKIHNYLNTNPEDREPTTLKGALDDLKGEFKSLLGNITDYINIRKIL